MFNIIGNKINLAFQQLMWSISQERFIKIPIVYNNKIKLSEYVYYVYVLFR